MQKFGNLLIMVSFVLTNVLSYCEPAEDTFCKYLSFHGRGGNYDGVVVSVEFSVAFKLGLFIYLFIFSTHITLFISIECNLPVFHQLLTVAKLIYNLPYLA